MNTGVHVRVLVEVILITVQSHPAALDERRTNAVSGADAVGRPCAHGSSVFSKLVENTANGLGGIHIQLIVVACVTVHGVRCATINIVVTLVGAHILPALDQLVVNSVVKSAVHFNYAGANGSHIAAGLTYELCVNNCIVMTVCHDNGTEIDHRLTSLAVGSIIVTVFSTGCFLIENGQLCVMDVIRRRNGGQLGGNIDGAREGILIVDHTVHNFTNHVDNRLVAHIGGGVVGVIHVVVTVEGPNTDGNADQRMIQSLGHGSIRALHRDGQELGDLVIGKGCLEACGHDSALGFPLVSVVQLQSSNQLGNVGQISHVDVYIVNRLSLGGLAGIVVTVDLHHGVTGHGKGTSDLHGVAQLVLDLEDNGMDARAKSNVALGGKRIAVDGSLDSHTVNSDLTGGQIQSGVIGHGCGESYVVAVDGSAVFQRNSGISGGVGRIGDGRQDSVIHSGAVVQRDIINIEGYFICSIGLDVGTDEGGRTAVALIGSHGGAKVVVLGDINGCVDPTGLGDMRVGSRVQVGLLAGSGGGKHEVILHAGVAAISCLGVELGLEGQALAGGGECVLGNVQPHTQSGRLLTVGHVTKNDCLTGVEQHVIGPACKSSIGIVQSPSQSVVTVSDLTSVGGGGDEGLAAQVLVELTRQRIRANQGVVDAVVLRPLLGLLEAHEACLVAILEVEDDLGALTELNGVYQLGFAVGDSDINAGNARVIGSGELEAVQLTGQAVGQRHGNRIGIHVDVGLTRHSHDGQGDGADLIRGGVRNHRRGSGELEDLGVSHGDGLGAHDLTAGDDLHVHVTLLAIGDKLAVNDATEGSVGQCPGSVSGHVHGIAVGIDGLCGEGVGRLGSEEIVVGLDIDHVKDTGRSHVGDHEDTMSGGTLCAVAGYRTHGEGLFTDALAQEGRGSTTVAVSGPLTSKGQHGLTQLIIVESNGVVGATTVIHTNDQRTVLLDTDHGTGGGSGGALLGLGDQLAILNSHTKGYANRMEQNALLQVLINVSLVVRLDVTGNVALGILENVKDGGGCVQNLAAGSHVLVGVTDPLAVVNKNTGRIGVVVQVGIHTADDVVAEGVLIILSHLGQLLMRPICLIFQILVDLVVTRNNGNVRVRRVYFNDMKDLSASTGSIVEHDLGLNCRTGNQHVILLGDYVVIAVRAEAGPLKDNVVLFPIRDGRESGQGQRANEHDDRKKQSYYALCRFSHDFFSFV